MKNVLTKEIQDGRGVSGIYTNLLPRQFGIMAKLQRNHPEKPTEHQLERRQKKPLHHNETGRECGGGERGLAVLPWPTAEVLEGYFSGLELSYEKCVV